jgi:hypothetical protein
LAEAAVELGAVEDGDRHGQTDMLGTQVAVAMSDASFSDPLAE